jgi:ADP-ribosylglycohydrolase
MNHPLKKNPDRLAGLVYGAFVADALALGAHWVYDQDQLAAMFGRVTDYLKPRADSYHPNKGAGEQTHYGDQSLVLMESIAAQGAFDAADFAKRWQAMWPDYNDYKDHATKDTLARLADGLPPDEAGSDSEELGGAARIAPLLAWMSGEPLDKVVGAARKQTSLTHTSVIALDSAEFFTWVVDALLEDQPMETALEAAASRVYAALPAAEMLERAIVVRSLTSREAVKAMGLACPASQGVPAMLPVIRRRRSLRM